MKWLFLTILALAPQSWGQVSLKNVALGNFTTISDPSALTGGRGSDGFGPVFAISANATGTSRTRVYVTTPINEFRLRLLNVGSGGAFLGLSEVDNSTNSCSNILFRASIEYPNGSGVKQVLFNQSTSVTVAPAGRAVSDPIFMPLQAGYVWVRVFYDLGSVATNFNPSVRLFGKGAITDNYPFGTGEGLVVGNHPGTLTDDHTTDGVTIPPDDGDFTMAGFDIVTDEQPHYGMAMIGDSIAYDARARFDEWFTTNGIPCLTLGVGEDTLTNWFLDSYAKQRSFLLTSCKHVVVQYGVNDIGSYSASIITNNLQALYNSLAAQGKKVWGWTITPRILIGGNGNLPITNLANQVLYSAPVEATREAVNTWIRTSPSPLTGFIDAAAAVETTTNSGWWAWPGYPSNGTNYTTGTMTAGSDAHHCIDSGKTFTLNVYTGYEFQAGTTMIASIITNNTTTIVPTVVSPFTIGTAYAVMRTYTVDGVHPTDDAFLKILQTLNMNAFK